MSQASPGYYQSCRENLRRAWVKTFRPGIKVLVGEPERYDLYKHAFEGTLKGLSGYGQAMAGIVIDQDGEEFQVSLTNIKKMEE